MFNESYQYQMSNTNARHKNNELGKKIVKYLLEPLGGLPFLLSINCKSKDVNKVFNNNLKLFFKDVSKARCFAGERDKDFVKKPDIL